MLLVFLFKYLDFSTHHYCTFKVSVDMNLPEIFSQCFDQRYFLSISLRLFSSSSSAAAAAAAAAAATSASLPASATSTWASCPHTFSQKFVSAS